MTFEMVMAAMYLAHKVQGTGYDYELEERRTLEHFEQMQDIERELNQKYPKDRVYDVFALRCKLYVPAYDKCVECIITRDAIHICDKDEDGKYFSAYVLFGYGDDDFKYANPESLYNRTSQVEKAILEAVGYALSYGIYEAIGKETEAIQCENKVNVLLKAQGVTFEGKTFVFKRGKEVIPLFPFVNANIDLDKPFEEPVDKIPYKVIHYDNREYIVVPYKWITWESIMCVSGNTILLLSFEEEQFQFDDKKIPIVRTKLRDPCLKRDMVRKDRLNELQEQDRRFFYEVIAEGQKLSKFFDDNSSKDVRESLFKIIANGILGNEVEHSELKRMMYELSGKAYEYRGDSIWCGGSLSGIFDFCKDVYER